VPPSNSWVCNPSRMANAGEVRHNRVVGAILLVEGEASQSGEVPEGLLKHCI